MPLVSDPGYRVVTACIAEGIEVRVVPGPSAVVAALVVSGLPMERFAFEGFPPKKAGERMRRLETLQHDPPDPRLLRVAAAGPRRSCATCSSPSATGSVAVCRELTKLHEDGRCAAAISEVLAELGEGGAQG